MSCFAMADGWVYIMTNKYNKVLYTGMTGNLKERIRLHKTKRYPGSFTARYNVEKLVWYQWYKDIADAYRHEQQIKAGSRQKKIDLINTMNPEWKDLYDTL